MIIMDLSQILLASLYASFGKSDSHEVDENLIRHMALNSIRSNYTKFRREFGTELVIASDSGNSWRKDIFPLYKANRKKGRDESPFNWDLIFKSLNKIKDELDMFFPYCVMRIDRAEADDIIGTLANRFGNTQPFLIISSDKDFKQLHHNKMLKQWDPLNKKWIVEKNPELYLREHVLRGDVGDGVPNFLSSDSCLVEKVRQKPISSKSLEKWLKQSPSEFCDEKTIVNYNRNKSMIDLSSIPVEITEKIIERYEDYQKNPKDKSNLFQYFMENKLRSLMECIGEF